MALHRTPPLKESPSQTAGPYVTIGLAPNFTGITGVYATDLGADMFAETAKGQQIEIAGTIIDGDGFPVFDAMLELWQADADGNYVKPGVAAGSFAGWGRQAVSDKGAFSFRTIKPGRVAGPDGKPMAPHVSLWIVARGINIGLQTRLYFADESNANSSDYVLNRIMNPRRRETLVARKEDGTVPRYVLDIHLQGDNETVFFDF